jgi:hypothetical protein
MYDLTKINEFEQLHTLHNANNNLLENYKKKISNDSSSLDNFDDLEKNIINTFNTELYKKLDTELVK